jgi:hypothetical protein
MKFHLCLFTLLFTGFGVAAQAPGGISGSVLWLKANTGASASTWTDNSGSANDFSQGNGANQPSLVTNTFNFYPALQFDGINTFLSQPSPTGFPINNDDRTMFVVAKATDTNGYRWIFVYGNPGTGAATCQMGNNDQGGLSNAFYGPELSYPHYWSAANNANGAMAAFTLSGLTGLQYDRGNYLQFVNFVPLSASSSNGVIGALNTTPNELWAGSIGEVILFNTALSDANRQQVESYLALKYGFTLGSVTNTINYTASDGSFYWIGNSTFQNDVFGIGTDNGTALTQTQSNSMNSGAGDGSGQAGKGNLILNTASSLADKQFLMIGNDAGAFTEQLMGVTDGPTIAIGSQRVQRNWKVQNTGAVGAVDLSFDTTGFNFSGGSTLLKFQLMIDNDGDGDYTTGTQTFVKATSATGNKLNFTGITLNNNVVFTILTGANSLLPAFWEGFTATVQNNNVALHWNTSEEHNVDHYNVEHALNGTDYAPIGSILAQNKSTTNRYDFIHNNPGSGKHYYRIKMVDKDGKSNYTSVRLVNISSGNLELILNNNPVAGATLGYSIFTPKSGNASIRIFDLEGKTVLQQQIKIIAGNNTAQLDIANIPAGTYLLQVITDKETSSKKFIRK